jgi:hypothetical protein
MATTTPNFGWPVPTSTDLVKDGATAIEALGDGIDASLLDLKGGTTGQVLAKASATDMDFSWVAQDDSNAIQNAIVDAKGDLIAATAADTPARLAVGTNGQVLTADSTASTGLAWSTVSVATSLGYAAGKNKIINGDFGIWQRGTSGFGLGAAFNADRFAFYRDGSGATEAITQQTFTPGTAPVAGYEGQYFWRYAATVAGTGGTERSLYTKLEDVRTFAGQTVNLSFWAKADATRTITLNLKQNFGSGGSTEVTTSLTSQSATTSWARYSVSVTLPSISGKTIGTSSFLQLTVGFPVNVVETIDLWGFQLEAGSTLTSFQTATGSVQGELAACQRYLPAFSGANFLEYIGYAYGTNTSLYTLPFNTAARVIPTGVTISGTINVFALNVSTSVTPTLNSGGLYSASLLASHTITAGQGSRLQIPSGSLVLFTGCEL